jgi:hypothetical protein
LFYQASQRAKSKGLAWNCHITIHLESIGIAATISDQYARARVQLLKKHHQRRGMACSYGWVLENGRAKGVHVHILIHRPENMPMNASKYRWDILRLFKLPNKKGVMKIVKFSLRSAYGNDLPNKLSYVLKGIRPEAAGKLKQVFPEFNRAPSDEGLIYGNRIGWSR